MFRPRWVAFLGFVVLVTIAMAVRFGPLFQAPLLEEGDLAVNALQIQDAKRFREVYGNYSRYEFNHPGPAFFYVYAGAEALLYDAMRVVPSPGNAHLVAIVCLQFGFLAVTLWLLSTRAPWRPLGPLALLAVMFWIRQHPELVTSVWPPDVIAVPFLCFLVACTLVAVGDFGVLPVAMLAGGFLFHGHVAQALFVGTIGAVACVFGLRARKRSQTDRGIALFAGHRIAFVVSGVLGLLFSIPLLVDILTLGGRGNVAAIFGRFSANAGQHASLGRSLLFFLTYPIASRAQDALLSAHQAAPVWHFALTHAGAIIAASVVLLTPAIWLFIWGRRMASEERRFLFAGGAILGMTWLDCLVWGMAQSDAIRHYNGVFYHAVYFFAALFILALVAKTVSRYWTMPADVGAGCLAAVVLVWGLHAHPASAVERGLPVKHAVDAVLADETGNKPKFLVMARDNWHVAAAVALELRRHGDGFFVPDWWGFMFHVRSAAAQVATDPGVDIWWVAPPAEGGVPLTSDLSLYRTPAALSPEDGRIDFTDGSNAFRYVVTGIQDGDFTSAPLGGGMITNQRNVLFRFVPRAADRDVEIAFDAASAVDDRAVMPADVLLNGQPIGRVSVGNRQAVSVSVPRRVWVQSTIATLELRFPTARPVRAATRPGYRAWMAWRLWSIRFATIAPGN